MEAGIVKKLVLNDLDKGIYSLYKVVKEHPEHLISKLQNETPTHKNYFEYKKNIETNYVGLSECDAAWNLLVANRLAYSGIVKANPLGGKNGSTEKLLSRWNPKNLIKRIHRIHSMSDKIEILNNDACEVIEEFYWAPNSTIFIDPPYYNKGKDLYNCYYVNDDHLKLSMLLDNLYSSIPGADMIVTYDYTKEILDLYAYPQIIKKERHFSI